MSSQDRYNWLQRRPTSETEALARRPEADPGPAQEMDHDQTQGEHVTNEHRNGQERSDEGGQYRDEVYSKRVPAGKRTYFFDVKTTRSGEDFYVTITESKRVSESRYEKHKIFLYKEDFGKFVSALHEVVRHIVDERLPHYDFRNLPELSGSDDTSNSLEDGRDH